MSLVPRRVFGVLLLIIGMLTAASLIVHSIRLTTGHDFQHGLMPLFDLNGERNIASWFSSFFMLAAATLLCCIGIAGRAKHDRFARHWLVMAAVFLGLAIDEVAAAHELLTRPLREGLHVASIFHYAWIIPGSVFALTFLLMNVTFLRHLPARTRTLFVLSGALFVGSAVGMEMLEGYYDVVYGHGGWGYVLLSTIEEVGEMVAMALFINVLMDYMAHYVPEVRLRVSAMKPRALHVVPEWQPRRAAATGQSGSTPVTG